MRFIGRSPLWKSPECIHDSSRTIRELIVKPPLVSEWSVSISRKALKIRYPVQRAIRRLLVVDISGTPRIECFDSSQARGVTVAALIGQVTAECHAISLLRSNQRAMNRVFWPFGRSLYPLDQLFGMLFPVSVLLWMQENVASQFERNHLIQVIGIGINVLEIARPDIVLEGIN